MGLRIAPWPCWHIAASPNVPSETVSAFLAALEPYVDHFDSAEAREKEDVDFVVDTFGQKREDVVEWLASHRWVKGLRVVEEKVVRDTLRRVFRGEAVKFELMVVCWRQLVWSRSRPSHGI